MTALQADLVFAMTETKTETRQRREPARGKASMRTVAACVRRFCLECVGATSARGGIRLPFSDLSPLCVHAIPRQGDAEESFSRRDLC